MRIRWVGMLALSGLLVLSCAGEESGGQTDASTADGEGANGTVQLAFELGGELRENQPVLLTIRAETLGGEIAVDLAGEVALSSSIGVVFPEQLTMEGGVASGEIMLSREGNGLLNASLDGLGKIQSITVEVTDWVREPLESVLSGGAANEAHWTHGGIHSPVVVMNDGEWEMFFSTRPVKSEVGNHEGHVLGRAVSSDGGVSWALEPDAPIWTPESAGISGFGTLDVVRDETGMYWLFHTSQSAEGLSGIQAAKSPDGLNWESAPCLNSENGLDAFWTQQGVMDPSVVSLGEGEFQLYFAARREEAGTEVRDLGAVMGSCAQGWGDVQEVLPRGSQGSWDSAWVSQPHVWRENALWRMLYVGAASDSGSAKSAVGYASSEDGWVWSRAPSNPVIQKEEGFWEVHGVGGATTAVLEDGSRGVFYTGYPTDKRPRIIRLQPSTSPLIPLD